MKNFSLSLSYIAAWMPPLGLPSLIPFAERARNPSLVRSEIKSLSNSASVIESIRQLLLNRHHVMAL